jgi:hypothetical protein
MAFLVTAKQTQGASGLSELPAVFTIFENEIKRTFFSKEGNAGFDLTSGRKILCAEKKTQLLTALNPTTSNPYLLNANLAVTAAGANQGAATALATYFNKVTTATVDQGVRLPAGSAVAEQVHVIQNGTAVNVKLYPATDDKINALADNAALDIPAGGLVHIYSAIGSTDWVVAKL